MTNYAADNQHHELLQFLRSTRKSTNRSVVDAVNHFSGLNGYHIIIFEGEQVPLGNHALIQAVFDDMPNAWKNRCNTNNENSKRLRYHHFKEVDDKIKE